LFCSRSDRANCAILAFASRNSASLRRPSGALFSAVGEKLTFDPDEFFTGVGKNGALGQGGEAFHMGMRGGPNPFPS